MEIEFKEYLTLNNIYIWSNIGILPFWLMLAIIPNSKITQILINSIVLPLILSTAYIYIFYQGIFMQESILSIFTLYLSLDNLYTIFASENFLLLFWIHFVTLNLFLGTWVSRDSVKYQVVSTVRLISLILIYFTGPTMGYLIGFLLAVYSAGVHTNLINYTNYKYVNMLTVFSSLIVSLSFIYILGLLWLGYLIGWDKPIFKLGAQPFLLAEFFKILLLTALYPWIKKLNKVI